MCCISGYHPVSADIVIHIEVWYNTYGFLGYKNELSCSHPPMYMLAVLR